MTPFEATQVGWIHWFQRMHSPLADSFFTAMSYLGEEWAFLLAIPILYLGFNWKIAGRLSVLLMASFYFNTLFKDLLDQPRPFEVSDVLKLYPADGHGIPSGHAQSSFVFWVYLSYATQIAS